MKYHLPVDKDYQRKRQYTLLTLCGRWVEELYIIWDGASETAKEHYGCKSCLRIAGQKRQPDQGQEDHE